MVYDVIHITWLLLQLCVAVYLLFPVMTFIAYLFVNKKEKLKVMNRQNDYAVIVTAYKNHSNLDNVISSLLKMDHSNYTVYVVADDCAGYRDSYDDERVIIIKPQHVLANQVTSHFLAISNFKRDHAILTIIDSDNLVKPDYLSEMDRYFNNGYEAVQGVRKAKNLDTPFACIDAVNEIYYLFYDRRILFAIGSSSMLSGSGMAFTTGLYKECMGAANSTGAGFDKILQKTIIEKGYRIAFAEKAVVFDEKTSKPEQLVKQRARWNNTWFRYYKFGLKLMGQGIRNPEWNRFLFGFILTRPPLFILIILSILIMFINLFISIKAAMIWAVLLIIFTAGFFIALGMSQTDRRIYRSLVHIPGFILLQVLSLFKARKANQYSVATEHSYNKEIEKI